MVISYEEAWLRARADYDLLYDKMNRELAPHPSFSLLNWCAALEHMLHTRFNEVGLGRYAAGKEGVAGVSKILATPKSLEDKTEQPASPKD